MAKTMFLSGNQLGDNVDDTVALAPMPGKGRIADFFIGMATGLLGNSTCTFDLQKNGVTILSAVVSFSSSQADNEHLRAVLLTNALPDVAIGDLLTVDVDFTIGTGTVGEDAAWVVEVVLDD